VEAVRPATGADLDRLEAMARAAVEELTAAKGGIVWRRHGARHEPLRDGLATDLEEPRSQVLVGTIDDAVVGYAVTTVEALADGGDLAVLRDLYVEPDARGVGVGAALMEGVLAWARERECMGVDSVALPGSRETKNFFESFGLVARAIIVHRTLDLEPGPGR
jgi:GNAT superfamily N-acetyltransferase